MARPSRAMVAWVKCPVEKIMTLGAVATGSMKAHEAERAACTMNILGSAWTAMAVAAMIGMRSVVVAVLLVTSVRNVTARQIVAIIRRRCRFERAVKA